MQRLCYESVVDYLTRMERQVNYSFKQLYHDACPCSHEGFQFTRCLLEIQYVREETVMEVPEIR